MNPSGPGLQHALRRALVGGRQRAHQLAQRGGRVAVQFGVGGSRLLEVEDVEEVVAEDPAEGLRRRHLRPRDRWNTQPDHTGEPVRVQQRGAPGHHAAEVVADDDRAFCSDVIEQADDVGGQLDDVVGVDGARLRRTAVAALIGRQHAVAGLGQRRNLVTPGVRQFGEAVGQHHHRRVSIAGIDYPQLHPVGLN